LGTFCEWTTTAKTSCTLQYKRFKEKAWKTVKELNRHHTTRFEKHWHNSSLSTEKAGVEVWPDVSLTRHELSSKVRCRSYMTIRYGYQIK